MSVEPTTNPFLEAEIERALAPYVDLLAPEALAEFRDALLDALTSHPVATDLVRRLAPAPEVASSGELSTGREGVVRPKLLRRGRGR